MSVVLSVVDCLAPVYDETFWSGHCVTRSPVYTSQLYVIWNKVTFNATTCLEKCGPQVAELKEFLCSLYTEIFVY